MRVNRADEIIGLDFCEHAVNPDDLLDFKVRDAMARDAQNGAASRVLYEDAYSKGHSPKDQEDDDLSLSTAAPDVVTVLHSSVNCRRHFKRDLVALRSPIV